MADSESVTPAASKNIEIKLALDGTNRKFISTSQPTWSDLSFIAKSRFSIRESENIKLEYVCQDGDIVTLSSDDDLQNLHPISSPARFRILPANETGTDTRPSSTSSLSSNAVSPTSPSSMSSSTIREDDWLPVGGVSPSDESVLHRVGKTSHLSSFKDQYVNIGDDSNKNLNNSPNRGSGSSFIKDEATPPSPQNQHSHNISSSLQPLLDQVLSDPKVQTRLHEINLDGTLAREDLTHVLERGVDRFLWRLGVEGEGDLPRRRNGYGWPRRGFGRHYHYHDHPPGFLGWDEAKKWNENDKHVEDGWRQGKRGGFWKRGRGFGFGFEHNDEMDGSSFPPPPHPFGWRPHHFGPVPPPPPGPPPFAHPHFPPPPPSHHWHGFEPGLGHKGRVHHHHHDYHGHYHHGPPPPPPPPFCGDFDSSDEVSRHGHHFDPYKHHHPRHFPFASPPPPAKTEPYGNETNANEKMKEQNPASEEKHHPSPLSNHHHHWPLFSAHHLGSDSRGHWRHHHHNHHYPPPPPPPPPPHPFHHTPSSAHSHGYSGPLAFGFDFGPAVMAAQWHRGKSVSRRRPWLGMRHHKPGTWKDYSYGEDNENHSHQYERKKKGKDKKMKKMEKKQRRKEMIREMKETRKGKGKRRESSSSFSSLSSSDCSSSSESDN